MLKLFGSYIDPAIPLKPHQAKAFNHRAWKRWQRSPANTIALCIAILTPIVLNDALVELIAHFAQVPKLVNHIIWFLLMIPYLFAVTWVFRRFRYAPCVYAELHEVGFDVCLKCGYWLRDLDESIMRCPECGQIRADRSEEKRVS